MSQQPTPIDVNRLKDILGGARAIMQKVNTGNYQKGSVRLDESVNGDQLLDASQVQGTYQQPQNTGSVAPRVQGGRPVYKNMETSKMPAKIKEAMMTNYIPQMSGPNHTFTLDDVSDLAEKPMPMQPQQRSAQQAPINESNQQRVNDTFTVSESALRGIIKDVVKEELLGFMSETFSKSLTEETIKKTINTLIKEGKIKTKKRVNS